MRTLLTSLLLLLALLASPAAAGESFDGATEKALNAALDKALEQCVVPGAIAGVWMPGQGTWKAVRGVTDVHTRQPMTLDQHTRIGSVTKTFTVTLLLQLVDQGKLSLSDPLSRWFPEFPHADRITLRMLANMSSGLPSYTKDEAWLSGYFSHPTRPWAPQQLVDQAARMEASFQPGEKKFEYSNTNTVLLGLIIEKVTGKPLARVLEEEILKPLGLRNTSYPPDARLPEPYLHGYTVQGMTEGLLQDATDWSPTFGSAAGQMVSRLDDLAIWARALGSGSLLKPETQKARLEPTPAQAGGDRYYCLGLGYDHGWLAHTGELPGYNASVGYLPAREAVIVVIVNSDITVAGHNPAPTIFRALAEVVTPEALPNE